MMKLEILLVGEDTESLAAIKTMLDFGDYDVIVAPSAEDALRRLLRSEPAVILVDLSMRKMDGYELARLIRSRRKSRHIPLILMSGQTCGPDALEKACEAGAQDFLQMPVAPVVIRSKVGVFTELFRKTRQLRERDEAARTQGHLEEQKRFQDLAEGVEHGFVWSADPETFAFNYVSPRVELLFGYPVDSWRRQEGFWLEHIHPDDRAEVRRVFESAQLGKDTGLEHRFLSADGETAWLYTAVRLARKGSGAGVELRGLSLDLSRQKAIERDLNDAVRVRDEFLSIASHELKTPLTPLLLQLQLLERSATRGADVTSDRLMKAIEVWRRQVDRLARLVDELLDASRVGAKKLALSRERFDLRSLVDDVLARSKEELTKASCSVSVESSGDLSGSWDKSRIEQVLMNLLSNAEKYAPGQPIEISLRADGDSVRMTVRDHGRGISKADQARIFERFERVGECNHVGGLGLGLYISKKIVEAHGGEILVESQPGDGARFTVVLPREDQGEQAA